MPRAHETRNVDDLDDIDLAIIRHLQADGRKANAQLARDVGVSEPTVRKRIDRLTREDIIRSTAILNPRKTGYQSDVLIGVRTQPGRMLEVGEQLAQYDQVVYLGYTTGRYDIIVEILFPDDSHLLSFLQKDMAHIEGVVNTETFHVLQAQRNDYDVRLGPTPRESQSPQ